MLTWEHGVDPDLVLWVLGQVFAVEVPDYHHARPHPSGALLLCDAADVAVLAVVFETQHGWDPDRRWAWKLSMAQTEAELKVNAALMVYCPDPKTARRYRGLAASDGLSLPLRPYIFTPEEILPLRESAAKG